MKTTTTSSQQRIDVYTRVTERVVADLERGVRPWLKPWTGGSTRITMPRRHNGIPYRGINVLILWAEAIDRGYSSPLWMTYRQALEISDSRWAYDTERLVQHLIRYGLVPRSERRAPLTRGLIGAFTQVPMDLLRLLYEPRRLLTLLRSDAAQAILQRAGFDRADTD